MNDSPAGRAQKVKKLLIQLSPLIENYTSRICPGCADVCCKQKRSLLDHQDILYITAMQHQLPDYDPSRHPEGPCQFMGVAGCMTPRWLRPWRCTWYFCSPLIESINSGPQKKARALSSLIQQIIELRNQFT